ncbi:MAG: long-chain-fatty-acid--CoA ligase [Fimbriimonadales bacterium]|nr:MAG: long-chain-fatty-acid--CoA ligase [Fimbriimonadales bacterium]
MLLHQIIERGAQRHPDKPAVIFREHTLSYAQLWGAVNAFARGLREELGIQAGDRVGIMLPNLPQFVIAYHALGRLGAIAVPVNPLLKAPEIAYIWNDAGVKATITFPMTLETVLQAKPEVPSMHTVLLVNAEGELPDGVRAFDSLMIPHGDPLPPPPVSEHDPVVFIYTSGTTGFPKGVMLSSDNILFDVEACQALLELEPNQRFLTVLPLFHSFGQTVCMNFCLWLGGTTVLMERFLPQQTLEALEKYQITMFPGVPAMYAAILQVPTEREYDLKALKYCFSGGAPMPEPVHRAFEQRFNCVILEGDGPTECSPATSVNPPPHKGVRKIGSVGLPLPGVEIKIFDDNDNELPVGEIGEIVVRGRNVMLGYYNNPEATAEAMRNGWYHTGDMGKFDKDGYLYIVDRKKDMIIVGGINVYPSEVERVLMEHPAVAMCAVIGKPDPERGEVPIAVIVPKPDTKPDPREIIRFARERLANFKVPREVIFRSELPISNTGKVLKRLLKKELELES